MFDRDENGIITTRELGAIMRSLGFNPTEEELQTMINEVDYDGEYSSDVSSFMQLVSTLSYRDQDFGCFLYAFYDPQPWSKLLGHRRQNDTFFRFSPSPRVQCCSNRGVHNQHCLGERGTTEIDCNNNAPKLSFRIRLRNCVKNPVFWNVPRCFGQGGKSLHARYYKSNEKVFK